MEESLALNEKEIQSSREDSVAVRKLEQLRDSIS